MELTFMNQKSIYRDGSVNSLIGIFLLSAMMIGFSLYLTQHYFDLKFPTGLESKSLCNISQFFNCDKTTLSAASNIFGIPISLFGAIIGGLTMLGMIIKNEDYERTIFFALAINFVGCIALFLYSLLILKGLCPFCSFYYIVSGVVLYLFQKRSSDMKPSLKYLAGFAILTLALSAGVKMNVDSKTKAQGDVATDLIKQYYSLPDLGTPTISSQYKIASAENAPIKMVIFSDFECPACRALSEMMPLITARYEGKIDIQYFFYPLDNSCNPSMDRALHQYACKAAFAASCMPAKDFARTHDEIFHNQDKFESGYIDQFIKNNKLETCVADPKTKENVVALIKAANPFNIRSTPSYLINGVKIEGALPLDQMFSIMDEILKRAGK